MLKIEVDEDEDQIQVDEDDPLYEAPPPPPPPPPDPRLQITPDDKYHNKHWMLDWAQKLTKASIQFWPPEAFQINQRNYWQKLTGRILSWPGQIMRLKVHIVWWPKLCWWWTTVIKVWRCDCNAAPSLFLIQNLIRGSFPKGVISGQSIIDTFNWNVFVCLYQKSLRSTLVQEIKSRFTKNKVHSSWFNQMLIILIMIYI